MYIFAQPSTKNSTKSPFPSHPLHRLHRHFQYTKSVQTSNNTHLTPSTSPLSQNPYTYSYSRKISISLSAHKTAKSLRSKERYNTTAAIFFSSRIQKR